MKQKGLIKKLSAVLLATAMTISAFPQFSTPVLAKEKASTLPDVTQFATVEQLKSFNTDDRTTEGGDGKNPAKVYFGNNDQQWWIAGHDTRSKNEENIVLFAASPLATGQKFAENMDNKTDSSLWSDCTYLENVEIGEVYPNHYGASSLRNILKDMTSDEKNNYFSSSEKSLMSTVTIYTSDTKNSSVYSTTDKLYLPYGDWNNVDQIIVGINSPNSLNNGLRIDKGYWHGSNFWLRAPDMELSYGALVVNSKGVVVRNGVVTGNALVPAFEFNLSSVLFASAMRAVSTENMTLEDREKDGAFTLRYDASQYSKNLGSALVSYDKNKVTLTGVPTGTYLVVQNSDGAKAKKITTETEVSAKDDFGLDSFANCKVWLETTDTTDRMTYATLATEQSIAEVNGIEYTSLELALNSANDGDTVVLLKDIEFNDRLSISKNINFDLNGKTININSGNLNINSNIAFNIINKNNGDIKNSVNVGYGIINQGILTTEGSISCDIYNQTSSSKIENGTYLGTISNEGIINNGSYSGVISLDFNGIIKDGVFDEKSMVDGYGTIDGGEYRGYNRFLGSVNGGDFYSPVTLCGPEYNSSCKGVVNGGNFAQEPNLGYGSKYGEGLVLAKTNNDELPYKVVKEDDAITLKITLGNNLTLESGKLDQAVEKDVAIQQIMIEVNNGYYLPDTYISDLQARLNGLTVTETDNGFTISGTPTSDVNVTLPAATILPKSDTPVVELKTTSTSITATVTNHKDDFGDIEYKWNDGNWEKDKNTLSNLDPNTPYKLAVRFTGQGIYQPSEKYTVEITTLKDGNTVIVVPTGWTATYKEGLKLSDVDLSGTGWTWVDGNAALSAGTNSYPATFDTTDLESTTDFSKVDGYDPVTHKVTKNVEIKVDKADSQVTIITQSLDKAYDGKAVNNPKYKTSGAGEVSIKWQEKSTAAKAFWKDLDKAPSTVGSYRVVVELAGNDNYNPASATLDFVISKADNAWTEELSIKGWTYNEKANAPSAKAQFGDVTFTYSSEENGTYTNEVPKNAGTWYVKATVVGTENYTSLESTSVAFEIVKSDTDMSVSLKGGKTDYVYGDMIGLTVSVAQRKAKAVVKDKVAVFVGENQITEEVSISEGKSVDISIDTTDETVKKYLKPSESKITLTVKYGGSNNLNEEVGSVSIQLMKKDTTIKFKDSVTLDKTYDGQPVELNVEDVQKDGSSKEVMISWQTADGKELDEVPTNAGTYKVVASVEADDYYKAASIEKTFTISKIDSKIAIVNSDKLSKVYDGKEIVKPEVTKEGSSKDIVIEYFQKTENEWKVFEGVPSQVGDYKVVVSVEADENYNEASVTKEFSITKSDTDMSVSLKDNKTDYVYGDTIGLTVSVAPRKVKAVAKDKVAVFVGENQITDAVDVAEGTPTSISVNTADETVKKYLKPSEYEITLIVKYGGSGNLNEEVGSVSIQLAKKDTTIKFKDSLTLDKTYDGQPVELNAEDVQKDGSSKDVTISWQTADGKKLDEEPTNAGTYKVVASVEADDYYKSAFIERTFTISKAIPTPDKITGLVLGQGKTLEELELPEGFAWKDKTQTADELGQHDFEAIFTPQDSTNYEQVEVMISVEVVPNLTPMNHAPTIETSDKELTVGDQFAPLKDVTAKDKEDGDLTSKIEVVENEVDTSKAGTYEVTYKVTDSQGASITKTINVVVLPKMEVLNQIPTIEASDKELTVGDEFDPLKDVTAEDKEDGDLTSKIEVVENEVDTSKARTYEVTYKVTDSQGASITKTVNVVVLPKMEVLNQIPTIEASDKELTVGDKFDPLKDVTAKDKEDGDLTSKIEVVENEVDTSKAGTYKVTYKVTDSQGAIATKTIQVVVKTKETPTVPENPDEDEKPEKPDTDKPGTDKPSTDKPATGDTENSPAIKTGDEANLGLWTTVFVISGLGIATMTLLKRRKYNR